MSSAPPVPDGIEELIVADRSPQRDYVTLSEALDATLIWPLRRSPKGQGRLSKVLEVLKVAWAAFRLRLTYEVTSPTLSAPRWCSR